MCLRPTQTHKPKMKLKCDFCKICLPLIFILAAGFYIAWLFVPPSAANQLRIAAGSEGGAYYQYAQKYQQALQTAGIELELQSTAGSVESLQLLLDNKVDLAFIQGGIGAEVSPDMGLHSVASLFYEPLWVFTTKASYHKNLCYLKQLEGKKLAIGAEGSGTNALVKRLLNDNGLNQSNTSLLSLDSEEAVRKIQAGEIDVAFFVAAPESESIKILSSDKTLKIMNFERHADAYIRHYPFLNRLNLSRGTLNLQENIPGQDKTLLTATAALVVGENIHADHVRLLARAALNIHHKPGLLEKAWQFPSRHHLEIPIHPDAEQYLENGPSFLEKYLPFSIAARIDQFKILLIPLLTLLFPLVKGFMPLYAWRIRSRTFRWYKNLNRVDRELDQYTLTTIKQAIIDTKKLHSELAQEVSVPLSYMSEFYTLRVHTDHILKRLQEREMVLQGANKDEGITFATEKEPEATLGEAVTTKVMTESKISNNSALTGSVTNESELSDVLPCDTAKNVLPEARTVEEPPQSEEAVNATQDKKETVLNAEIAQETGADPKTKYQQAQKLLRKHVAAAMTMSAIPIPFLDVATLTGTQLSLLQSLSEHYGVDFDRKRGKAVIAAMLGGSLPATAIMGLSSISKLIPGIGTLGGGASLSVLAGSVTYATGKVLMNHYEKGGSLDNFDSQQQRGDFQEIFREGLANKNIALAE